LQQNNRLESLDRLLAELGGSADAGKSSRGPCGLLLEHLDTARRSLLGSMPGEYRAGLEHAKDAVACISDDGLRTKTKQVLAGLIELAATKRT
jgi:hypothetical protein